MSRSVSAPSSVTNTSPCWNGLIVPGSTFRYGSNFCSCTRNPRAFSSRPSDAATIPFPSALTTPPVTKTYFGGRALTGGQGSNEPGRTRGRRRAPTASVEPAAVRDRRPPSVAVRLGDGVRLVLDAGPVPSRELGLRIHDAVGRARTDLHDDAALVARDE